MPAVNQKVHLRYLLASGPVGVGECHTAPDARTFVQELIDAGCVKRMFVEYPTEWQPRMDALKAAIEADDEDEAIKIAKNFLYSQQFYCDAFPLAVLFGYALEKGVDVWCSDHFAGGGRARFRTRHQVVRDTYYSKTQGIGPKGSLILFGSHHFDDVNNPLDAYIPNLQYYNF